MLPTLASGNFVLGIRRSDVKAGDLVAFPHPDREDFWLVKRAIATHGLIDLDSGTVDGEPYEDDFRDPLTETGRYDIAPGTMFVLSDNRNATRADSRTWGPVPLDDAFVLRLRYWPADSVGRL